ncbi:hypothetical protein LguiB_029178 [Lonicera macranthoides]
MSDQHPASTNPTPNPSINLGFVINSNGSITRLNDIPSTPATPDPTHPTPVLTKDIPLNQSNATWLRMFLPREAPANSFPKTKLPLIVYYHGGGFIVGSVGSPIIHAFCEIMAVELPAIVVSVEYRLAPEHRLPTAYNDCMEALHCIKTTNDGWLLNFADFSNTFLMGGSAGGNIAYHAGLRAASDDLSPLKIRGLILQQPFFGGTKRTDSELRLANDKILPLRISDVMWELGLPVGVDRDHEYCNPVVGGGSHALDQIRMLGWKVLVTGCDGDPLIDCQIELVKMLEKKGVEVVGKFSRGDYHGIEAFEPPKGKAFCVRLKEFIFSSSKAYEK